MRSIRISEQVWQAIADRGKFGQTADDVLRSVFELASTGVPGRLLITDGRKGRGSVRYATKRMSARTENSHFIVEFDDGAVERWKLPSVTDKHAIKRLRDAAVSFAVKNGATDPGQTNAVRKALTSAGYHLTK